MNEAAPTSVTSNEAEPKRVVEDPRAQKKQRMTDAFTIGSVQSRPMDIEFFNRTKR